MSNLVCAGYENTADGQVTAVAYIVMGRKRNLQVGSTREMRRNHHVLPLNVAENATVRRTI